MMGSRKGLLKKLRPHEIVLPVAKGSKPMTSDEINDYFKQMRKLRDGGKKP
jgi:hypothetical protein